MKYTISVLLLVVCSFLNAQTIIGEWETFDDESGEKLSIVEIYKTGDQYFGKIKHLFEDPLDSICEKCEGDKKDQPIIGLIIIENLKADDDEFNGGTILDPDNGKTYKCYIELEDQNKLKLRGYIGFSLIGRTQYWQRKT